MDMDRIDLLVTGFGPFPGVRVNPTTGLARAVAMRLRQSGLRVRSLVLETSYAAGLPALGREIEAIRPRAVLMLGLAARARHVRVELFARGRSSALHPDVTGKTPARVAPRSNGALPARTTARPQAALADLRRQGIRSRLSPSAGRYLCDASYATALRQPAMMGRPVLFVHVPWLRPTAGARPAHRVAGFRPRPERLSTALAAIGRALAIQGR
jgi:pyroglutamyl-peptidase